MTRQDPGAACDDGIAQLYAEGGLSEAEAILYERHLAVCPACRRAVAGYKELFWDLGRSAYRTEPVPEELQRISDDLMARWEEAVAQNARAGTSALEPVLAGARGMAQGLRLIPGVDAAGRLVRQTARRGPKVAMSVAARLVRRLRSGGRERG
ncbi:MAG: zf-HC2 domain-containing protein [Bacillota bacterium]